jgi:hypothetical protein
MTRGSPCTTRGAVAALGVIAALGVCTTAIRAEQSGVADAAGIAKLTTATRQEAVACGNAGAGCASIPYDVCPAESDRYSVRLITPFSRVASAALEAKNTGQPLGRLGPAAVNQWGIGLAVYPAERSRAAEAIGRVEIHRDGAAIQPTWSVIGPATTRNADGTTQQLSRGFFVFPLEAFLATSDITVVLFGQSSETTCSIDRAQLSTLR